MRAFVYLRQSLDRTGAGVAVDRQREDCIRLCADRGWEVARVFVDNDVSASSKKPRPAYNEMLAAIENGEADLIVAWHMDRLTRKVIDLEHLIELSESSGVRVATVTGDYDLTTDTGRLLARILASVARGEVERKGARQKRAQQQAAEQGRPSGGRRAFGYSSDGLHLVEAEAAHVRAAYADVLAGASLKGIARTWNDAGQTTTAGNPWRHDNVRGVLLNPRNAGLRTYRGQVVGPAVWEPIVDRETHEAVSALLTMPDRRTTATVARKYLLPAIALCWKCGSDVATGHTKHGKRVYVCRANKCISRKAEPVDEFIEQLVVARLSQPDAVALLSDPATPDLSGLHQQAAEIQQRIDDLATALEEGILPLAKVRESSARLNAELSAVSAKIATSVHADALTPLVTADDVEAAWKASDLAQKRRVIDALMTITLLKPEQGHQEFSPEQHVQIEWKASA